MLRDLKWFADTFTNLLANFVMVLLPILALTKNGDILDVVIFLVALWFALCLIYDIAIVGLWVERRRKQ